MLFDFDCQSEKKIFIKESHSTTILDMDEVALITCDGYLSNVLTLDDKSFKVCKLLKRFEEELMQFGFIRANHNTLVNAKHIQCIFKAPKRKLVLKNKIEVNISRRKLHLFK